MTDRTPLCLVPACDAQGDWPLPIVVLGPDLALTQGGQPIGLDAAYAGLVVAVSLSPEGAAALDRFEAALAPSGRSLADLRQEGAAGLVRGLAQALVRAEARIARQLREASQLRQLTERSLQNFERLEAFVWSSVKAERQEALHLAPKGPLARGPVEQRLPIASAGLSDLAVHLAEAGGRLVARLVLLESGETAARWQVEAPEAGWLRLALPRALGGDAQTAILRIEGEGLALSLAAPHPDPRFQAQAGAGALLALRLWTFIPGTAAPLAPEAVAPDQGGARWLIGLAALAAAGAAADPAIALADWGEGLALRPAPEATAQLCLPGLVRPGMRRLQGFVVAEGAAEAAFAVSPRGLPPETADWQALGPDRCQIHLALAPAEAPRDLWLMARGGAVLFEPIEGFADDFAGKA